MKMSYEEIIEAVNILTNIEEDIKDGDSKVDVAEEYGLTIEQLASLRHKLACLKR